VVGYSQGSRLPAEFNISAYDTAFDHMEPGTALKRKRSTLKIVKSVMMARRQDDLFNEEQCSVLIKFASTKLLHWCLMAGQLSSGKVYNFVLDQCMVALGANPENRTKYRAESVYRVACHILSIEREALIRKMKDHFGKCTRGWFLLSLFSHNLRAPILPIVLPRWMKFFVSVQGNSGGSLIWTQMPLLPCTERWTTRTRRRG